MILIILGTTRMRWKVALWPNVQKPFPKRKPRLKTKEPLKNQPQ